MHNLSYPRCVHTGSRGTKLPFLLAHFFHVFVVCTAKGRQHTVRHMPESAARNWEILVHSATNSSSRRIHRPGLISYGKYRHSTLTQNPGYRDCCCYWVCDRSVVFVSPSGSFEYPDSNNGPFMHAYFVVLWQTVLSNSRRSPGFPEYRILDKQ